jgi:hypothetical protein
MTPPGRFAGRGGAARRREGRVAPPARRRFGRRLQMA